MLSRYPFYDMKLLYTKFGGIVKMRFSDFSDLRAKTEVEGITAQGLLMCEFGTADLTVGTHQISSEIRKLEVLGEGLLICKFGTAQEEIADDLR